jgi:hypothetical protein
MQSFLGSPSVRQRSMGRISPLLIFAMLAAFLGFGNTAVGAEACSTDPLPCLIRVLGEEKANSEEMARLLHAYVGNDVAKEAGGIKSYSAARAAFEGVIEELKSDVNRAHSPANGPELKTVVEAAVTKSHQFASYVDENLPKEGAARGPIDIISILAGSDKLLKVLVDAGIAIWDKFHERSEEEKSKIGTQLEQLRWKSYSELTGK